METEQHDDRVGEHQPDPAGTETAPLASEPVSPESPEPEPEPVPVTDPPEEPEPEAGRDRANVQSEPEAGEEPEAGKGILVGTGTELEPGVGGVGDHPAPAVVVDPSDGSLHVAGEPPSGTIAGSAPAGGDASDLQSGEDVTDPEARERLNAVQEPEQIETERPDLGTE